MRFLRRLGRWYCGRLTAKFIAGDLCSIKSEDHFRVVKVLATGDEVIHVKLYKEEFHERPQSIWAKALSLGTLGDPEGFGVGHLPLARSTLGLWLPVRFQSDPVTDDELVRIREWEKSGRDVLS